MYKTLVTRHVKTYGKGHTYYVSLAGEKMGGGFFSGHVTAAYEAELFKWYIRNKYGVRWVTMRAYTSEANLKEYAAYRGFKLTISEVFQHFSEEIREKLNSEGGQIAAKFAELELPTCREVLVREGRRERQQFKRERIALKAKLNQENAAVWRAAQSDVSLAWRNAKLDVEAVREFLRDVIFSAKLNPSQQLHAEDLLRRLERNS